MSLARDIAIKLGNQLRGGTTIASTPLSSARLQASSLERPKFTRAVAAKINKRLVNYIVKSLTLSEPGNVELVVTCEICPLFSTN